MQWIKDYIRYAERICDAPRQLHKFVGLAVLAASLGNRVWFIFGDQERRIYPCLWVLLLAPSSTFRKSSAIGIGRRILYDACGDEIFLPLEFSPEELWKNLASKSDGILIISEFSQFVGQFGRSYMMGAKELLIDLFDNPIPRSRETKAHGKLTIRDAAICMLSGSTTEWFLQSMREGDVKGGFLARWIYVPVQEKEKRIAFPRPGAINLKNELVRRLKATAEIEGEATLNDGAVEYYERWFNRFEVGIEMTGKTDFSAFYVRLEMYCLKFAVLIELSETGSLVVSRDSMEKACSLTDELYNNLLVFAEQEFALSHNEKQEKRVIRLLRNHSGRLDYVTLSRNSHMSGKELEDVLRTLEGQERVRVEPEEQPKRGKPKRWVVLIE